MARKGDERLGRSRLRKETKDWLTHKTIPTVRDLVQDLEEAGEDTGDLVAAIDELEALLRDGPDGPREREAATSEG